MFYLKFTLFYYEDNNVKNSVKEYSRNPHLEYKGWFAHTCVDEQRYGTTARYPETIKWSSQRTATSQTSERSRHAKEKANEAWNPCGVVFSWRRVALLSAKSVGVPRILFQNLRTLHVATECERSGFDEPMKEPDCLHCFHRCRHEMLDILLDSGKHQDRLSREQRQTIGNLPLPVYPWHSFPQHRVDCPGSLIRHRYRQHVWVFVILLLLQVADVLIKNYRILTVIFTFVFCRVSFS